jgi:hypothetical protein
VKHAKHYERDLQLLQCDEAQPTCTYCEKRNLNCIYPIRQERSKLLTPPTSITSAGPSRDVSPFEKDETMELAMTAERIMPPWIPPPTLVTSSGGLSLTDMRLLHHWSTITCSSLAIGDAAGTTLQMVVPQLAFENDFLLNAILGIASLDLGRLKPDSQEIQKQSAIYRGRAFCSFRNVLPRLEPGTRTYEAALVMSILLVVLYSPNPIVEEDELIIMKWLIFYRGLSVMIKMSSMPDMIMAGSVGPFFRRQITDLKIGPVVPKILVSMLQEVDRMDPDFLMLEYYCKVLDALGILYASLKQDGLGPELYIRVVSWCSYIGPEFTDCATQRRPRALILMSHFLVFIKVVKGLWWLESIPERDLGKILKMLGPRWAPYLEVPLKASMTTDKDEIAALLLR